MSCDLTFLYARRTPTIINNSPSGHNFYIRNSVKKLYLNLSLQVYVNYDLKMFKRQTKFWLRLLIQLFISLKKRKQTDNYTLPFPNRPFLTLTE